MFVRIFLIVLALFAAPAAASPFSDAAMQLDGDWRGGDFVLRVDARRAQASIDAARPFAWDRFLVKDVTPDAIVFSIGAEIYEARIADGVLTLTGTSFQGTRVLAHEDGGSPLRGTDPN